MVFKRIFDRIYKKYKCYRFGHSYLIDEFDKHGMVISTQCIKCGNVLSFPYTRLNGH